MMISCPTVTPLPSVTCFKSGMVLKIGGMAASEVQVKGKMSSNYFWDCNLTDLDFLFQPAFNMLQFLAHGCPFYLSVVVVELLLKRFLEE